ncbi:mannose-1-phosphate guanylyltransferase/mannose-6-phosphate isomerase [Leucothrix mucor]|uniref:mannose-1-phosphate guanylyltransferase/mannose-6-phosphate isomerase n=1 Tax=Leucothrix mucor TaxID=45248 RepID=UPI0003B5D251|nr:mannose-1-phosphate guanylyltransferase/mannose-6-phosphate isomerase [Leucothrix mucor]
MIPIVLSGGSGTRLWPFSRKGFPKQFLSFIGEDTLLQSTLLRLPVGLEPIIVCNEQHRFIVAEQLLEKNIKHKGILLEPVGRNTAPAVAIAAMHAMETSPDELLLVLAADHAIENEGAFHKALDSAVKSAEAGNLVTFGVTATSPHTGFGYIKAGNPLDGGYHVDGFVEKPDIETANDYIDSGQYYWNSGMFVFRASVYLDELKRHRPDVYEACENAFDSKSADLDFIRLSTTAFELCPDVSIDYAVMERTDKAVVVPLDAGWNDIGSWSAIWDISEKDAEDNVCHGDIIVQDSKRNLLFSEERLVTVVGVDDLVVVETKDAVLVANKESVQDVKKIVSQLKDSQRPEAEWHRVVYRPWGCYDSIDSDERFQVKRITVKPGATLSLQKHHHRAEHWIVVSGTAEVTCDDKVFLLTENQSTYIPLGSMHRLSNPGKLPLQLIEVQSGSYLGEDDIVRFEDVYGR